MADAHKNFAYGTVLTAPVTPTAGTSLVLNSGQGATMPAVPFNATVWPVASQPTTSNAEIVRVTAVSTDTLTITRTQESSNNRSILVGDQVAAGITVKTLTDIETLLPTGTIVGTTDVQDITNKTLHDVFMGNNFVNQSGTPRNITLDASKDFVVPESIEIGAGFSLEVPSTSSMEVITYAPTTAGNPIGSITMYGGSIAPAGYRICDGSAISRTTFAALFAIIGVTYGIGDGSTTFNLPDLRGRLPIGSGTSTATGATLQTLGSQPTSGAGGEQTHVQALGELASHSHTTTLAANSTAGGTANYFAGNNTGSNAAASNTAGSSTAMNILPPVSVVNFIIKT